VKLEGQMALLKH